MWGQRRGLTSDPLTIQVVWDQALRSGARNSRSGVREDLRTILTRTLGLLPYRTETMVEKLLTNWLSICLYAFLKVRNTEQHLGASAWLWSHN